MIQKTIKYGCVVALCLVGVFGTEHLCADDTAAAIKEIEQQADRCMDKGLQWLKEQQRASGSWSDESYPAMTALGLWAFARSGHPQKDAVCALAAAYVAGFVQEDGGIYKPATGGRGSGGLSTYNTAICMIALYSYNKNLYAKQILKAREFVTASQLIGGSPGVGAGGFGYNRPLESSDGVRKFEGRDRPDLSNTGWSLQAMRMTQDLEDMRRSGQRVDVNWAAALSFVESLRNNDQEDVEQYGGFGYEPSGARGETHAAPSGKIRLSGYGSMTYAGLESMIYSQVERNDPRVRSALQWAAQHWSVDENPGMGSKGLFYYFNIMAKALSLNGSESITSAAGIAIPWKEQLIKKLVALQSTQGSWVNADNQFWEGDPVLVTCYAILTLEYARGL